MTGVSPTSGPAAGGTLVTISGTNLAGATAVKFGATTAAITSDTATQIVATLPAESAGTVDITVTTSGGTSATSSADHFTYAAAPTVTAVLPASGPLGGGTTVTLTGTGFTGATAVTFGTTAATSFTFVSDTSMTAVSPAGTGTVDITVTTSGGTSATSSADHFTYAAAPTVTGVSPTSGPAAGGTLVTISGTNLAGATAVKFGATTAAITSDTATQIVATSPAESAGTVDITVTTSGGTSATSSADHFTYAAAPTVTAVLPASGPLGGGTTVTLTGTGFTGATAVTFGTTAATSFTFVSDTSMTAVSPAGTGTVDITVTTSGGTSATSSADHFTYAAAPTVTGVSPTSGPAAGGTLVTISGTNLAGATAVKFGATTAAITSDTATQIVATSPAESAGTVDITVTTSGGTSATSSADHFTYAAAPTVTAVLPASGPLGGGTTVTLTGTGFTGATAVTFGTTAATSFTFVSDTSMTAVSPAGTGTVDITVTTPSRGTSATSSADHFTYLALGMLRVTSSPAVNTQISLNGVPADSWGLNWLELPPGSYVVHFSHVEGYTEPADQTVTVTAGNTTIVTGNFTQRGELQVTTSPAVAGQISVDSVPRDDWGLWTDLPTGLHSVCFGPVAGYTPPACQNVLVGAGKITTIAGTYTLDASAPGASALGMLRVTSSPAVNTQISLNGVPADSWGLNWLELPPGSYVVHFSHVEGYTEPADQTVTVTAGNTTIVTGNFTQRGELQVTTSPAVAGQISVDSVPRDDWGLWTDLPTGLHSVCFGPVAGYTPPACQNVLVGAGALTAITGVYP